MGNKTHRHISVTPQVYKPTEAFIYYLNRSDSEVYLLKDMKIERKSFSKTHRFTKDSAIGYLTEQSIMLTGGTSRSGSLKRTSLIIDMDQMFIRNISPVPIKCKLGSLHSFKSFMYLASGVRANEDLATEANFLSLPLMRYKILENYWEVFNGYEFSRNFNKIDLNHPFNIETLVETGSFIYSNKLFIFAGKYLQGDPNLEVFSFDLLKESGFVKEKTKLQAPIFSPICIGNNNKVIVYGGRGSVEVLQFSSEFFVLDSKSLQVTENHPGKLTETYMIQVAYPRFAFKSGQDPDWTLFNLTASNFGISAVTLTSPPLHILKTLPPATPRGRFPTKPDFNSITSQDQRVGSPTLHISYLTVQLKSAGKKNSPNERIREKFNKNLEFSNQEIIEKDNDVIFRVNKKVAVKVVSLIFGRMDKIELNPLRLYEISNCFGIVAGVSIEDIGTCLVRGLGKDLYDYQMVKAVIKVIYRNCEKPRVNTRKLNELLEDMQVPEQLVCVSKDTAVFILTRMIKAIAGRVE